MKQKTITTDKAALFVVELPDGGKRIEGIACDITGHFILWDDGSYHDDNRPHGQFKIDDNPTNKWQLLGSLPDITEEQADGSVEKVVFEDKEFGDIIKYRDYTDIPIGKHNKCYAPITALKSLYSLLQANDIYFENPMDHPMKTDPKYYDEPYDGTGFYQEIYSSDVVLWDKAQSKAWNKEQTYIFIKVD